MSMTMHTPPERAATALAVTSAEPGRSSAGILPWIASLFALKTDQYHPVLGLIVAVIVIGPQFLLKAAGHQELALSFSFGVLFTGLSDLAVRGAGATYATRVRWTAAVVLTGTLLTALGYLLDGAFWLLVALAVFATTLLSMLAAAYGKAGATSGNLLNIWFVIALSVSASLNKTPTQTWPLVGPQTLSWLTGGALWLLVAGGIRLVRQTRRPALAGPPQMSAGAPSPAHVSRPLVGFAVLAAVAVGAATAVAWGLVLPNADWMVVAAIVAMKPSLQASAYAGAQRVVGAILGSLLAAILLTLVHDRLVLLVLLTLLLAVANAIHDVNYALYYTASSAAVLIALGLPHPGSWTDIWQRMGWTLAGVGIALEIMLLAGLASQQQSQPAPTADAAPHSPPQETIARTPTASEHDQRQTAIVPPMVPSQSALEWGQSQLADALHEGFPRQVADYHAQLHLTMERVLHLCGGIALLRAAAYILDVPFQPQASEYVATALTTWEIHHGQEQTADGKWSLGNWIELQTESTTTHFRGYALEIPGNTPCAICLGYLVERVPIFGIRTQAELDRITGSSPSADLFRCELPFIRSLAGTTRIPIYDVETLKARSEITPTLEPRQPRMRLIHVQYDKQVLIGPRVLTAPHFLVVVNAKAGAGVLTSIADLPQYLSDLQHELNHESLAETSEQLGQQMTQVLRHISQRGMPLHLEMEVPQTEVPQTEEGKPRINDLAGRKG